MANPSIITDFDAWLSSQESDVCAAIAVRSALRVFPLLNLEFLDKDEEQAKSFSSQYFLSAVRAAYYAWARVNYPNKDVNLTGAKIIQDAPKYVSNRPFSQVYRSCISAGAISKNAAPNSNRKFLDSARNSIMYANHAAMLASDEIVRSVGASNISDATFLRYYNTRGLLGYPLWISRKPDWVVAFLGKLSSRLISLDEHWEVWINWYEAILEGQPTAGDEKLDLFRASLNSHQDWNLGPSHVNGLITSNGGLAPSRTRMRLGAINPKALGIEPPETSVKTDSSVRDNQTQPEKSIAEIAELEVPPQIPGALIFGSVGDGPIDVVETEGTNRILDSAESRDSHSEVVRFITVLIELHESGRESPNNGNVLAYQEGFLLSEALGATIKDVRPGLLVPRGEALRQRLSRNVARDELSDAAPLSDGVESAVSNVVKAYNTFVGLDPELSKRDEASFGPDAMRNLVPPEMGQELAKSARESGVITAGAETAIAEEGKVAPLQPDPANRSSRRFSEGVKNLFRATIGRAVVWVKANPVISSAGTALLTAKWVLANEQWLLKFFADHPAMLEVLNWLLVGLKALPLG